MTNSDWTNEVEQELEDMDALLYAVECAECKASSEGTVTLDYMTLRGVVVA